MRRIILIDFDGTLIDCDSMWTYLREFSGWKFPVKMIAAFPVVAFCYLSKSPSHAKERLLSFFLKGISRQELADCAGRVAVKLQGHVVEAMRQVVAQARECGDEVAVVSASPSLWVAPVAEPLGVNHVLATELEYDAYGVFTGRFATPNCVGVEKVNRIRQAFGINDDNRGDFHLVAYGDSNGDTSMLAFADEPVKM